MSPNKTQPVLLGGLFIGVLSALPFIKLGNCFCCLWVVGGGMLAAYLLQQNSTESIRPGEGALVGLLAGIVGACVELVISVPLTMMMGPMQRQIVNQILNRARDIPPQMRDMIERMGGGGVGIAVLFFSFVFMLCISMIFSTLGGLLGAVLFKKSTPAAQPPPPPEMPRQI